VHHHHVTSPFSDFSSWSGAAVERTTSPEIDRKEHPDRTTGVMLDYRATGVD
jgi:hypothetical protein